MTIDVWGSFDQGYGIGDAHRRRRQYGDAYEEGGLDAVEQSAASWGDLEMAEYTRGMARRQRQFEDDERNNAYQRMETIAPWARNVLRASRNMEPARARAFLSQNQQRFIDFGFTPEQVQAGIEGLTSADQAARDEWYAQLDAAFTQHQNPEWQLAVVPTEDGQGVEQRPVALGPNGEILRGEGSMPVAPGEVESFGSGGLYRNNPNAPGGYEVLREPRSVAGGGGQGGGYRPVTPEEAEAYGLPNNGRGYFIGPNGRPARVPGAGGAYTDAAASSAQFASRMTAADQTLARLEDALTTPEGVFAAASGLGGQSERQVRQAQREFVNAILRRESGAVISDTEFASAAQQYFPQPGDGPEVIAQKRAARRRSIQGLINASQGAYEEWYGDGSGAELPPPPPPIGSTMGDMVGRSAGGGQAEEWVRDPQTGRLVPARR